MLLHLLTKALLVALPILIVVVARFILHHLYTQRLLRLVPGPTASSCIWGEEWELYHHRPGSLYVGWHEQFGSIVKFSGAFKHQILSITDPKTISFILGEGIYRFPKPRGVRAWFDATLGRGILWVEGKEAHERQRRTLAPSLSQQSIRGLTPVFFETSGKLASQWSKILDGSHHDEVIIEVTDWAGRFALDTIGRAAFSYDFDCLSGKPHALAEALDGLTNNEHKASSFYMRALFWLFPGILSIGKKGEMIRKTKLELGEIASKMWRDAKVAGDRENNTLMAHMLRIDGTVTSCMTEEQLVSQMRTIISAAYETVSAVIAWVLYELAVNPKIQSSLREEVSSIQDHTMDAINGLQLLDSVLKETLRLHPPILENHHETAETISVPLSEPLLGSEDRHLVIPKGTLLAIPVNVVQTDPKLWGVDSNIFRPERWLSKEGVSRRERQLLAFSEGPRSCIGRSFAMIEIKVMVVTLIQQFSFRCDQKIEPFQSFVVRPRISGQTASSLPLFISRT